jgi:hypothetical protein
LALQAENAGFYPPELVMLKDTRLLFKVEKMCVSSALFDGSYRVKRVCKDPSIVEAFDVVGDNYIPSKVLFPTILCMRAV